MNRSLRIAHAHNRSYGRDDRNHGPSDRAFVIERS